MATLTTAMAIDQGLNLAQPFPQPGLSIAQALNIPSRHEAYQFVDSLFDFLFPMSRQHATQEAQVLAQFERLLTLVEVDADSVASAFFAALPQIRGQLLEDATAALESDPAANSLEEVIFAYPGFYAVAVYRLAHELSRLGVPLLPRMWSEYAHGKTGIDIHPAAQIGSAFVIDHGTGTTIGATAIIGDHVTLYHGVTLGALRVEKSLANTKRHPTIEDHVTVYANATILGGDTVVGHHSVLGGNIWVMASVPPHSTVYYADQATRQRPQKGRSS